MCKHIQYTHVQEWLIRIHSTRKGIFCFVELLDITSPQGLLQFIVWNQSDDESRKKTMAFVQQLWWKERRTLPFRFASSTCRNSSMGSDLLFYNAVHFTAYCLFAVSLFTSVFLPMGTNRMIAIVCFFVDCFLLACCFFQIASCCWGSLTIDQLPVN